MTGNPPTHVAGCTACEIVSLSSTLAYPSTYLDPGIWNPENLAPGIVDHGMWEPGILEPGTLGSLEAWKPGTLGSLEAWILEASSF